MGNSAIKVPNKSQSREVIADITGISIVLRTHKARFFFANEVTYNNGVPLKTVSRMLGQKSVKTTEVYVRANRWNISEEMEKVEKVLFTAEGDLKTAGIERGRSAKIIELRNQRNANVPELATLKNVNKLSDHLQENLIMPGCWKADKFAIFPFQ